ncbi:kinase D-interacting substrate of 220 kDa B-like isoform X2 [Lineus longissimus]|uniref:kinase D-interacting substrate of 220 kDa B-like isoform X2 n=1 Tax=Lineus longissimus TaxID=88925 RepID=UPI00315D1E63
MSSLVSRLAVAGKEIAMMPINTFHSLRIGRQDRVKKRKRGKHELEEVSGSDVMNMEQGSLLNSSGRRRNGRNSGRASIDSCHSHIGQNLGGVSSDSSHSKVGDINLHVGGGMSEIESIPCMCSCRNSENDICELHSDLAVDDTLKEIPSHDLRRSGFTENELLVHNSGSLVTRQHVNDDPVSVHDMEGLVTRVPATGGPVIIDDARHLVEEKYVTNRGHSMGHFADQKHEDGGEWKSKTEHLTGQKKAAGAGQNEKYLAEGEHNVCGGHDVMGHSVEHLVCGGSDVGHSAGKQHVATGISEGHTTTLDVRHVGHPDIGHPTEPKPALIGEHVTLHVTGHTAEPKQVTAGGHVTFHGLGDSLRRLAASGSLIHSGSLYDGDALLLDDDADDTTSISEESYGDGEPSENGQTFLMAASAQGNVEVVKRLLENDVEVNAVDFDDWTALHYACKEGQFDCLVTLLDNGASIEQRDVGGWTPLMWACYKGKADMVRLLLDKGANVHVKGEHHMSCIIWAAGRGYTNIVEMLLDKGAKVNTTDKYGTSPLVWAARKGHIEIIQVLLEHGANTDTAGMYAWTPLIVAARRGFVEVVRAILESNPNINSVDKDGFTALTCAVKGGHVEVVEDLLEKGAYVNLTDKDGDSILIHAVRAGNYEIVKILLNKYADVDVQGSENKTALYHAVEKGYYDIAKAIVAYSCDLELTSKDGDTPLMRAVRTRHTEMVDLLLHKGSKVQAKDKKGDTALHLALRGRSRKVTELLLRNPKNSRLLYQPNKNGETPYTIDGNHQKSILTQIYGARNLNASEANENLLGYELYSSTIADVLSEPTLCTPITVGLYAKWGSGKSFLLDKLKTEMQLFEHQTVDRTLQYTPLLFTCCTLISLLLGLILGLLVGWPGGLGVGCGLLLLFLSFIGLVWIGTNLRDWDSAYKISVYLGTKFENLKLLLQVIFCNPSEVSKDTSLVRYLFTGNTKLTTFSGEQSIALMVATLADEMEKEIGVVTARLFRVFKPQKNGNNRRYRSICCIPNFVFVIFVLLCIIACIILIALFPFAKMSSSAKGSYHGSKEDDDDDDESKPIYSFSPIYGTMIALGIVIVFAMVGNVYTWWQMVSALARPQRKRVMEAMKNMKATRVEKFIQTLKEEVAIMSDMVRSLNGFMGNQYRFVLFVDGLDSSEQEKLLQVLDLVNILFVEMDSPFVIILAVDPHIIIKGIEQNLPSLFRDSNINGHDYLRNVVHFPVFLQNQGLPIQRLLRRQQSRQNCSETNSIGNHVHRESPPKRQESVMSSTSLDKVARSKKKKDRVFSFSGSTSNYFASATDLSKTLVKNDYFSDMNPRSMRRLMNIVAITGRLLRAYSIDYSWHRLATWVNITEQWPYRTSWIIWFFEDNEDLDESVSLKEIYDKVVPRIPLTREVEPLLEIDRNVKKFEVFLSNNNPTLSVGDIKKFLPCCINIDPYLRKRIREYMKAYEQLPQEFPVTQVFGRAGGSDSSSNARARIYRRNRTRSDDSSDTQSPPVQTPAKNRMTKSSGQGLGHLDGRLPNSGFTPNMRPNLQNITPPYYSQFHHHHPSVMTPVTPMMRMPCVVPTQHHPSFSGPPSYIIGGTKKVYLKGGVPKKFLSSMLLDDVCQLLMKLEGLGTAAVQKYQEEIFVNNINGFVLYNCDLDELKPVLGMNFGDWQLFKAMILALRSREEEALSGVPSSDRYMNHYLAISSENLHMEYHELTSDAGPAVALDFDENTAGNCSSVCVEVTDGPLSEDNNTRQVVEKLEKLDSSGVRIVSEKDFERKGRLARKNSIAQQIQMESMILNDVIDEFSEGESDENDASSDEADSTIYFAAEDNDLDSRLTTPEVASPETREPTFPDTQQADESQLANKLYHRSSMKKPESSHAMSPFAGNSKVQFNIPENSESFELGAMKNNFYDAKLSELSPEHLSPFPEEIDLMMMPNDSKTHLSSVSPDLSDEEQHSVVTSLIRKVKPKKVKSPDSESSDGAESVNAPLLGKKVQKKKGVKGSLSDNTNRPKYFTEPLHSANADRGTEVDVQVHRTLANAAAYTAGYKQGAASATGPGKPSSTSSKTSSQASSRNPSTTASSESIKMAPDESKRSSAQSSRDSSPSSIHSGRHKRFSVTEVKIDMPIGSDSKC